jgi:hypothetical protein
MSIKRLTAAGLVASLFVGIAPATAWAAGDDSVVASAAPSPSKLTARIDFKAAAERALATTTGDRAQALPAPTAKKTGARYAASGGGGGGTGTVMMVVGLLASVAGSYFIYKEMTKETDQLTKSAQQTQGFHVR